MEPAAVAGAVAGCCTTLDEQKVEIKGSIVINDLRFVRPTGAPDTDGVR